jgi:hypothetical protein
MIVSNARLFPSSSQRARVGIDGEAALPGKIIFGNKRHSESRFCFLYPLAIASSEFSERFLSSFPIHSTTVSCFDFSVSHSIASLLLLFGLMFFLPSSRCRSVGRGARRNVFFPPFLRSLLHTEKAESRVAKLFFLLANENNNEKERKKNFSIIFRHQTVCPRVRTVEPQTN